MSSITLYSFVILISLMGTFVIITAHKIGDMQDLIDKLYRRVSNINHLHNTDEKNTQDSILEGKMRLDALEAKNRILLQFLNTSWTEVLKDTAAKITIQEAVDAHFTEDEAEIPNGEYWFKHGFID
mgnify:CR=1 FL=1|tara:strand:- start:616 stop:993 length:378 start_codon:yes stop_codon:yes gene_type:complete